MACEMIRRVRSVIGVWDQRRVIFSNCFFRSETAKQAQRRTAQFPFMHGRLRPIVVSDPWRSRADVPSCGVSPWGIAADGRELAAPGCSRATSLLPHLYLTWPRMQLLCTEGGGADKPAPQVCVRVCAELSAHGSRKLHLRLQFFTCWLFGPVGLRGQDLEVVARFEQPLAAQLRRSRRRHFVLQLHSVLVGL